MNKLTLIFIGIFLYIQHGHAQIPELTWEKEMHINESHYFSDVLEMPGGNIVLAGAINKQGERDFDIWLLELNSSGDTVKTGILEGTGKDIPMRLLPRGDNGYLLSYLNISGDEETQSKLVAVGTDFDILWASDAGKKSALLRTDIAADSEGNIWWLNTISGADEKPEVALSKLGPDGNLVQEFSFAGTNPSEGYALRALPDGTLAMAVRVFPEQEKCFVQVSRLGKNGEVLWKTIIPDANKSLTPQCLCCSPDNTLLAGGWAGMCYNPSVPVEEQIWDYDYLLSKIDPSGKVLWTRNYNREGSEKGTAVAVLPDGKIMAAGKCETSFTGSIGPWLLLVDNDGNKIQDHVYKFRFVKDQVARIICTSDGGLLMVGPGYIESENKLSGWVRKLNPVL